MTVKFNSQRFGWGRNYAILHNASLQIFGPLTTRGQRFAAGTADWSHLRALIVELKRGRQAIADALALDNVLRAAVFIEGTAAYADEAAVTAEYAALDAATSTLMEQVATVYNTKPERIYALDGTTTTTVLTAAQNTQANNAVNAVLALFTVG